MRTRAALLAMFLGALAVLAIGSYATADGGKRDLETGPMSGYLEGAPGGPISTDGNGRFEARIEDDEISYTLSYSDLEGDVTQAHIHFGHRSTNGGISAWLCQTAGTPGPTGTPLCPGARSGTVSDTIVAADVVGPAAQGIAAGEFDELVAALRAGKAYANVHSSLFPGGEVRGQINDNNQRDD
jgi:CHRD domain